MRTRWRQSIAPDADHPGLGRATGAGMLARVWALAGASHPGPTLAVTAITVLLGVTVGLELWRVVLLGAAMLCGQASVGLSNDWLDAARDRAAVRTDKPVARGDVGIRLVRGTAFATLVAAVGLTIPLGALALIAHLLFLAAGWCYNVGLKATPLSVLPYLVGFATLPSIVTLSLAGPALAAWWATGAGAFLGVAAHFANALPDLEDDRAAGIVGLPHLVGARASGVVTFLALAVATCLVVFGPTMERVSPLGWLALVVEGVIVTCGLVLALVRPPARPLFRLVILGALVAVASLLVAGTSLTG